MDITAATTTRRTGHAGKHPKNLEAGTFVTFNPDTADRSGWVMAAVVGRPRVRVWVNLAQVEVA